MILSAPMSYGKKAQTRSNQKGRGITDFQNYVKSISANFVMKSHLTLKLCESVRKRKRQYCEFTATSGAKYKHTEESKSYAEDFIIAVK